jgi:hypothetical protein
MKILFVIALTVCCLPAAPLRLFANPAVEKTSVRSAAREMNREADPNYEQACFSMGRMTIDYASGEQGLPQTGFRVSDPQGRRIAYDPETNMGQQEIPLAQAYLDCDENDETGELRECKDHIEICGPVSGTYRIELSPVQNGKFSLSVTAASRRTPNGSSYDSTISRAEWRGETNVPEHPVLLLHYSRESGAQITLTEDVQHVANK